jgi:enamine deaminase RidA (YjgF/YER057c/UK114 family)
MEVVGVGIALVGPGEPSRAYVSREIVDNTDITLARRESFRILGSMDQGSVVPTDLEPYYEGWHMSPGRIAGGLLFMTGMTGHRPDGTFAENPEEQIRDAFTKIDRVLDEAGLDWRNLVEMTSYHVGIQDHLDLFRQVRDEYIREPYPAWTAIEVAGFITSAIVEIRAVADATGTRTSS